MSVINSLALTTELVKETLVTYIFAMGDSRFYSRMKFPALVIDPATNLPRATRVDDLIAPGIAMAASTESILLSVTMSIKYEDDESLIPEGDSENEFTHYVLIRSEKQPATQLDETFQIRIPNLPSSFDAGAWVEANKALLFSPSLGVQAKKMVSSNAKQDKRARGSV